MPTSQRWKQLNKDVERLRTQFLPHAFDPLGNYDEPDKVQAHARAFVVFTHAEVESYIEGWAKAIVRTSEILWQNSGRMSQPLQFLLATIGRGISPPPTLVGPNVKDSPQRLGEEMTSVFTKYYKAIKNNHGIKEANILNLLAPLGVPMTAFSSTVLPNLDSYGELRGAHAHESMRSVLTPLDPEIEYKRAIALLKDLIDLDNWLAGTKRKIR